MRAAVDQHIEGLAVAQEKHDLSSTTPACWPALKLRDRERQNEQRRGEDRRNDARRVELQRQVTSFGPRTCDCRFVALDSCTSSRRWARSTKTMKVMTINTRT